MGGRYKRQALILTDLKGRVYFRKYQRNKTKKGWKPHPRSGGGPTQRKNFWSDSDGRAPLEEKGDPAANKKMKRGEPGGGDLQIPQTPHKEAIKKSKTGGG